jgi:hypothetical protein
MFEPTRREFLIAGFAAVHATRAVARSWRQGESNRRTTDLTTLTLR